MKEEERIDFENQKEAEEIDNQLNQLGFNEQDLMGHESSGN